MARPPTPAVQEALEVTDAATGDDYGRALAEVLTLAGPAADRLARRRDAFVEAFVVTLYLRGYRNPYARLSPHEQTRILDHLARAS